MVKRSRDEEYISLNGSVERKSKKQKQNDRSDKSASKPQRQQSYEEWKKEKKAKKALKKELKREKREKPRVRQHPKNLAKYGSTKEQKKARKLAKQQILDQLEARRAAVIADKDSEQPVDADKNARADKKAVKKALKAAKKSMREKGLDPMLVPLQIDRVELSDKSKTVKTAPPTRAIVPEVSKAETADVSESSEAESSDEESESEDEEVAEAVAAVSESAPVSVPVVAVAATTVAEEEDESDSSSSESESESEAEESEDEEVETPEEKAAREKAERKAAKQAEKEKRKAEEKAAEEAAAKAKADKKALKKAEKDKSTTNGASSAPTEKSLANGASAASSSGYTEHAELAALPASEITTFLTSKQITVQNAGTELRPITSFKYLPITDEQRLPFKNFTTPTPIQAAAWPYLLDGRDVIGVAETGSGKTLAFGVPCIRRLSALDSKSRKHIKACIVSPTRELALQIQEQLAKFTAPFGFKATCVYGGVSKDDQRRELRGTQIVVATPGRLNDFIEEGSIDLSHVDYMVLDEADRMLDTGFEKEVRKIISSTAATGRQTLMFTATWPQSVRDLASTFMTKPVRINIGDNVSGELRANTRITQEVEVMEQEQKQPRLIALLKQYQSGKNKNDKILVFCLYKKEATRIEEFISRRGFNVAGIHGDLTQQKRTESLDAFKQGTVPILVATDVAARGLDIPAVKLVINVTFPLTAEDYVHRIGRTGRAGQDGKAITFFTDAEKGLAGALINVLKAANQHVPEELLKYGTTVKKKAHDSYGAFYKDTSDAKAATKITFD